MKCQINLDIYSLEDPAFSPAAPLRRTSVFAGRVKIFSHFSLQALA